MILVTGGTGLIGAHLLLKLSHSEEKIRAIYRNEAKLSFVKDFFSSEGKAIQYDKIEWIPADITDIPALEIAFENVTHVYHCAGLISFDPSEYRQLRKTNIEGTANIVNLCIANAVKKLCYLSSIATLGDKVTLDPIDETTYWNPEAENNVYAITKFGAEMEVWRGTQEGLPVIILNPGVVLGEGFKEAPSLAFFKMIENGLSHYPPGSTAFVDVKNVVEALVQGMQANIVNERFIVIGANMSYKKTLHTIAEALNKKQPSRALTKWQLSLLWRLDWLLALFPWRKRKLTKNAAHSLITKTMYSNAKIQDKLHVKFIPLEETIKRIVAKNAY
ncbi:NAD-dependent epimerase/dehydratase family protein [Galbibacter orientalis]|uniref:NAD-dependent epimerase/dehydratase family protein n=1 Tax=Galbibacter orientalis TaxID=453852 RepID=UPI0030036080